jgi:cell division protein FtsB
LGLGLLHFYLDIERAGLSRRNSLDRRKDFEDKIAQQQKQIETLTATVQKVSDQVALSKPAPQLVANP